MSHTLSHLYVCDVWGKGREGREGGREGGRKGGREGGREGGGGWGGVVTSVWMLYSLEFDLPSEVMVIFCSCSC